MEANGFETLGRKTMKAWFSGNSTKLWRGLVITLILGLGGWGLSMLVDIPNTYAKKAEVRDVSLGLTDGLREIRQGLVRIQEKIDRNHESVSGQVDEINRHLRDRAGRAR